MDSYTQIFPPYAKENPVKGASGSFHSNDGKTNHPAPRTVPSTSRTRDGERISSSALAWRPPDVDIGAMSEKTLFEKIRDREIPADIVYQNDDCLAFRDISPQAPVHVLVVPKRVIPRIALALDADQSLLGKLLLAAAEVARIEGVAESGYRIAINNGPHGGESVPHLHVHVLGGRAMAWPPG